MVLFVLETLGKWLLWFCLISREMRRHVLGHALLPPMNRRQKASFEFRCWRDFFFFFFAIGFENNGVGLS